MIMSGLTSDNDKIEEQYHEVHSLNYLNDWLWWRLICTPHRE